MIPISLVLEATDVLNVTDTSSRKVFFRTRWKVRTKKKEKGRNLLVEKKEDKNIAADAIDQG